MIYVQKSTGSQSGTCNTDEIHLHDKYQPTSGSAELLSGLQKQPYVQNIAAIQINNDEGRDHLHEIFLLHLGQKLRLFWPWFPLETMKSEIINPGSPSNHRSGNPSLYEVFLYLKRNVSISIYSKNLF